MDKQELAVGLVELWQEYKASNWSTFQPTMTDFVEWLFAIKMQDSERVVKDTRTWQQNPAAPAGMVYGVSEESFEFVKTDDDVEASVVQQPGGVTTADKVRIKELYREGYSAARIRHMLKLNITLAQIYAIGKKR